MKTPPGPAFDPEDVDRLISSFNKQIPPERRRALEDALRDAKDRFKVTERSRQAQQKDEPERNH